MSVTYFNNMFIVPAFGKILCEVQQKYSAIKSPLYSTLGNRKPLKVSTVKGFNLFLVPTKGAIVNTELYRIDEEEAIKYSDTLLRTIKKWNP